jgi:2-methylcitrate dehydratase PrpD
VVKKTFSDEAFKRPEVARNLGKFKTLEDPASAKQGPLGVLVIEARGRTIAQPIEIPIGDAKRPVPPAQVVEKYIRNAEEVVGADAARQTARMLQEIETLSSVRPLLDRLAKRS